MTEIPASHRDLLQTNQVVILATNGADGFPQLTATWFLAEADGTVRISLTTTRQKTKNLQRRPEATLFFLDPANPYRTLEIRARAEIAPDADYVFAAASAPSTTPTCAPSTSRASLGSSSPSPL